MKQNLTIADIKKAKARIDKYINDTPVLTSSILNNWLGHEIYFKAEGFQKIGAFKARGACNSIAWLAENRKLPKNVIANSSGNHAQAVAWASKMFGISSTIYMPAYSSKVKIQAAKSYGAKVILGESREIVDKQVETASTERDTYWLPPFNHEQVILGQGTATFDALNVIGEVDAVFAPCGGGGLLSGTYIATKGLFPYSKVIGAEPLNANDAAESRRKKTIQRLPSKPDTLADGAMTLALGNLTFEYIKKLDEFYEITEKEMLYWAQWLAHLLKIRVEPTSALAMEATKKWLTNQPKGKKVLVILSGGNIDQETSLKIWENDYLTKVPILESHL